ncbi:MAG: hypothetical protein HY667_03325 [Chloroflexi bacterium]|nr:hypothetical protein [Chloroflexota bacterium]
MKSEALRNIKTMRQVKTSLEVAREQRFKTTNCLSRTRDEIEHTESLTDHRLGQVMAKEKRRFAVNEAAISKWRQRVLISREKLSLTLNKNRALTQLRHQLQRSRWENDDTTTPKTQTPRQRNHQVEFRY